MQTKQQNPHPFTQQLQSLLSKQCPAHIKCLLFQAFRQHLKEWLKLLRWKIEASPQLVLTTNSSEQPESQESTLWQSIDELETRIIENKQVVLHFKSIVECYDEEADDLEKVLEVKREVSRGLTAKIAEARNKLRERVLTKSAVKATTRTFKTNKDVSKSVSTIHSEDTYLSEKSERRASLATSFFNLWR